MGKDKEVEKCPKCAGLVFEVSKDIAKKRFCKTRGCGHVWLETSLLQRRYDQLSRNHQDVRSYAYEVDQVVSGLIDQIAHADEEGEEITLKQVLDPLVAVQESFDSVREGLVK